MFRPKNTNSPITREQLLEYLKAQAETQRFLRKNRSKILEERTARALRGRKIIFKIGDWKPGQIKTRRPMPIALIENLKKKLMEMLERRGIGE